MIHVQAMYVFVHHEELWRTLALEALGGQAAAAQQEPDEIGAAQRPEQRPPPASLLRFLGSWKQTVCNQLVKCCRRHSV